MFESFQPKKRPRKRKGEAKVQEQRVVSKEIIEDKDDSSGAEGAAHTPAIHTEDSCSNHVKEDKKKDEDLENENDKQRKSKKKEKKKKKNEGPMHFTANSEPRALDVIGDLEPVIFNEVSPALNRSYFSFKIYFQH